MEPIIYRIQLPLEQQDDQFMHIQELIEAKRNFLFQKQKKLKIITRQNHFLEEVHQDYSKYYNFILKQKNDQIQALQLLDNYIHDLTKSGQLTRHNIEDSKEEQRKILREIKQIKSGLDSIINDTDNIYANVKK